MMEEFNHFSAIADALPEVASQIVRKVAFDAQGNIQKHIAANGQVDTGFMMNSVYTVTSESSTYGGGAKALPEVERPDNKTTAYVAVAAEYAAPQNYGSSARNLPARPFFEPGIDDTMPGFESALSAVEAKLAGAAT